MILKSRLIACRKEPRGVGGYSQKNLVGVCGPLPKTLTLFMTKICDFRFPIYDLTLRSLGEGLCCWLYLACVAGVKRCRGRQSADGRRKAWWKSSFFKKKPNWRLECKNRYPIYDQNGGKMAKIDTQFMTRTAKKPYPLGPHIPIQPI